nr:unnamed protein product [Callosobruchus chinensis]
MPEPKHECELKNVTRGLLPLPPNASHWMRFKRWVRMLSLLNEKNNKCIDFFAATSAMRNEFYRHAKGHNKYVRDPPFQQVKLPDELHIFLVLGIQLWILPICYATILDLEILLHPVVVLSIAAVQSIPVISFFFIGYVKEKTKTIVIEQKMVCKHYLRTFFIPDLIAVLGPVFHIGSSLTPTEKGIEGDLEFMYRYSVLFCYFVRLQSLKKTLKDILLVARMSSAIVFVFSHWFTMTLMLHLMTSLVIAIPWLLYDDKYPMQSWFKQANIEDAAEAGVATVYAYALLMTCCYFFGVSHGGYVITMPNEEITLFTVSLIGRLYTLYMIADLLRIFGLVSVSESRYENITGQLNEYVRSINVPPHLRFKLLEYCKHKFHGHYVSEREVFKTLPNHIKTELLLHDAKRLLLNISVFQVLPRDQLGALIADMQRSFYSPGDRIEKKGIPLMLSTLSTAVLWLYMTVTLSYAI